MRALFRHILLGLGAFLAVCVLNAAWRINSGWDFIFSPAPHGRILGMSDGVVVHAYGWGPSVRGEFGLEYECVELVNRYYVHRLGHQNMSRTGHADSYFWEANAKGLDAFPNGSETPPAVHDIIVFDKGPDDGSVGHVGVIVNVDLAAGTLTFIEQNMVVVKDYLFRKDMWNDTLKIQNLDGKWIVDSGPKYPPVAGWSRIAEQSVESWSMP